MKDNKYSRTTPSWIDDFVNSFKKSITKTAEPTSSSSSTSPSSGPSVGPSVGPATPSPISTSNTEQSEAQNPMNNIPSISHGDSGFENDNDELKNTEININDLEAITWNDETYRVLFDRETNSASIINGFGNVVTTLPNVNTIEEVNKQLNAKQIVVSSLNNKIAEEMEDEINKAFAYIKDEDGNVVSEVDIIDEEPDIKEMNEDESNSTGETIASFDIEKYIENNLNKILENETIKNYLNNKIASMIKSEIEDYELRKIAEEEEEKELLYSEENEDFEEADDLDNIEKEEIEDDELSTETNDVEEDKDEISEEKITEEVSKNNTDNIVEEKQNSEEYELHPDAINVDNGDKFDYTNPVELIGKWAELFKEAVCPDCSSDLEICREDDNKADIICKSCSSKFYVDKNSGKIYRIK